MTVTELVSKFALRMNEQLLKTSGAGVLSSRKKTQKNLREVASPHHPLVRPRVKFLITGNQLSSVVKMGTDKT